MSSEPKDKRYLDPTTILLGELPHSRPGLKDFHYMIGAENKPLLEFLQKCKQEGRNYLSIQDFKDVQPFKAHTGVLEPSTAIFSLRSSTERNKE